MVRVVPGIAAGAHEKIRTGTAERKFGLSIADGSAQHAVARILARPDLELTGPHCHLGSQITSARPYLAALRRMVGLMARIRDTHGVTLPELDLGGGHGIAYRPGEEALDVTALARKIRAELAGSCAAAGLTVPRLVVEPGRAVAGPAGVALYRVLAVKRTEAHTFVAVDGGMSDNPRPALYGVRYAPRLVGRRSRAEPAPVTVVGRHCEAGDVIAPDVRLPGDVRPGDLLAVRRPAPTTCPWPPATTSSAARRSSPSRAAPPDCSCAASRCRTSAAATWVGKGCRPGPGPARPRTGSVRRT